MNVNANTRNAQALQVVILFSDKQKINDSSTDFLRLPDIKIDILNISIPIVTNIA